MTSPVLASLVKFLLRRGLTMLGGSAAFSDNDVAQLAGLVLMVGNEGYQAWRAHQADTTKAKKRRKRAVKPPV